MYQVPLGGIGFTSNAGSLGTNINASNASINNLSVTSATMGQLKTAIFEPSTLNTSVINASQLNLPPDYIIPFLNVSQLIAFTESFVDLSAINISATRITATSITAPNVQPTLTAGNNIDICGNVISSTGILPSIGNFTEINASTINASNLSTADLSIGSNLTLTNKLLNVNSTANVTQNSGDLITSGAVYSALNGAGIGDTRNLTNMEIYNNQSDKPIVVVNTIVNPGERKNIMQATYFVKFGIDSMVSASAYFTYEVAGFGDDKIEARIKVLYDNGTVNTIAYMEQIWVDEKGGGTRSGTLGPIQGAFKSNTTGGVVIFVEIANRSQSSNDQFRFLNTILASFVVSEALLNGTGSDLNLNTGNIQAGEANFNSLSIQEGSGAGQANIGQAVIGNDAFSNMMAISINGNTGATNYGFAQVVNGQTIMNAQSTTTYNSFRVENQEVASINYIGLAIGYEAAFFPLTVSGDAFIEGIAFISEVDSAYVDAVNLSSVNVSLTNLSSTKSSIDNLCVGNITITGNITANDLNLSTGNLVPGDNITIENNVISAYLSSNSQANLNSLQVDNNVDVFGVLNVSQTSTFGGSLNVSNIIYSGVAGQHEGSLVLYSNIVGNNFVQSFNSTGYEVNISATGNISSINFFVGNQPCLEIRNNGIETLNIQADDIIAGTLNVVELEADVFQCIDGEATFRFTTPLLNATTANISTLNLDELDLDELDLSTINASNGNFSVARPDVLIATTCVLSTIAANEITTQTIQSTNITATSNFNSLTADIANITGTNVCVTGNISCLNFYSDLVNTENIVVTDLFDCANILTTSIVSTNGEIDNMSSDNISSSFVTASNTLNGYNVFVTNICCGDIFANGLISCQELNISENISATSHLFANNVSANLADITTCNFSFINASNISGYQETLIAGTNISIIGNTISAVLPADANFSSINASSANISQLESSTLSANTINNSFLNTSFITCNDAASFGNGVNVTGEIECDELDTDQVYTINLSSSALDAVNITTDTITSFQYNISDYSDDAEASFLFRNGTTTRFIHTGGRLRFECDELQTSGVANFSTINASDIVGYQETLIAGPNITITGNTISTSAVANFSSVNAEFINSSNVVNVSEIVGADCDFGSGYIQSFKSELINASNMNLSNKLNASVVNASQINASNIVGYQETLIAGTNISIVGNTISTSADANFSSVNTSTLNALTLFTGGYVSIGGIITAPNQIGVLAYSKSGSTISGSGVTKLPYEETQYNIGGRYNTSTYVFTCPVAGRYYVYASYYTVNDQNGTVDLILDDGSTTRIIARSQEGPNAPGNNQKRQMSVIIDCSVGDQLYARMANAQIRLRQNTTTSDEILNPFVVQFLG